MQMFERRLFTNACLQGYNTTARHVAWLNSPSRLNYVGREGGHVGEIKLRGGGGVGGFIVAKCPVRSGPVGRWSTFRTGKDVHGKKLFVCSRCWYEPLLVPTQPFSSGADFHVLLMSARRLWTDAERQTRVPVGNSVFRLRSPIVFFTTNVFSK